jgi:hypothetical protein
MWQLSNSMRCFLKEAAPAPCVIALLQPMKLNKSNAWHGTVLASTSSANKTNMIGTLMLSLVALDAHPNAAMLQQAAPASSAPAAQLLQARETTTSSATLQVVQHFQ